MPSSVLEELLPKALINSSGEAVEVPILPTTIPAAQFAYSQAVTISKPAAKQVPRVPITVSPAPVTS